ncbi:MAG: HK97 family phage prohead protease [Deltaproteobacteria bacterium]|nr:HK97 family phage prohead protease [Deltaproteobacteria bacterium]
MDINMTERKELVARFQRECKGAEHRGPDMIAMTITPSIRTKGAGLAEDEIEVTMTATETDRHGDIVRSSGAKLQNYRKNSVVLFGHRNDLPAVGKVVKGSIKKGAGSVTAKVKFAETALGMELLYLYKNGFMSAWSIGFIPLKWDAIEGDKDSDGELWGPVDIKSWELLELSAVTVGACPSALTNAMHTGTTADVVKSVADWAHEMREKGIKSEEDEEMKYECECLDCGHKMSSDEHCREIECPECGGEMRRAKRPGTGKDADDVIETPEETNAPEPDEGGTPEETPDATPAPSGDGAPAEGDEADGSAEPVEDSEGETDAGDDEGEAAPEEPASDDSAVETDPEDEGKPADGDTVDEPEADDDDGEDEETDDGSDAEDDAEEALRQGLQDTFGVSDEAADAIIDYVEDQVNERVAVIKAELELDTTQAKVALVELRDEMKETAETLERLVELRDKIGLKEAPPATDKDAGHEEPEDDDEVTDDEAKEFAADLKERIVETVKREIDKHLGRVLD